MAISSSSRSMSGTWARTPTIAAWVSGIFRATPIDGKIAIRPGTTILAHTQEIIGGHNGYLAKMYSRSTVARSGLSVCRCAGVGDVGYISRWTMEISNHTQTTILVPVGFRICQLTFEYVGETLKEYHGKYGKSGQQWTPEDMLPKPYFDWDYDVYRSDRGK